MRDLANPSAARLGLQLRVLRLPKSVSHGHITQTPLLVCRRQVSLPLICSQHNLQKSRGGSTARGVQPISALWAPGRYASRTGCCRSVSVSGRSTKPEKRTVTAHPATYRRVATGLSNLVHLVVYGSPLVRKSSACEVSQSTGTRGIDTHDKRTFRAIVKGQRATDVATCCPL